MGFANAMRFFQGGACGDDVVYQNGIDAFFTCKRKIASVLFSVRFAFARIAYRVLCSKCSVVRGEYRLGRSSQNGAV